MANSKNRPWTKPEIGLSVSGLAARKKIAQNKLDWASGHTVEKVLMDSNNQPEPRSDLKNS